MDNTPIYRTAEALGIKQWERDGLAALVGPLSRGELALNMDLPQCGTAFCIGGWLAFKAGIDAKPYVRTNASRALGDLFYPGGSEYGQGGAWFGFCTLCSDHLGWKATAPQAARAIVNFLTLGDPRWDDVMAAPAP